MKQAGCRSGFRVLPTARLMDPRRSAPGIPVARFSMNEDGKGLAMKVRDSRGLRRPLPKPDTLSRTHRCEPPGARSVEIIGAEVDPEPARDIIRKQSACRVAPHDKVLPSLLAVRCSRRSDDAAMSAGTETPCAGRRVTGQGPEASCLGRLARRRKGEPAGRALPMAFRPTNGISRPDDAGRRGGRPNRAATIRTARGAGQWRDPLRAAR